MHSINILDDMLNSFSKGSLDTRKSSITDIYSKTIVLYGAGNIGKVLYKNLIENDVNVMAFIDRKVKKDALIKIPIYHPENEELDQFKENSYVILSALFIADVCDEIKQELNILGFKNILTLNDINLNTINNRVFYEKGFGNKYYKLDIMGNCKNNILEVFSLLERDQDKEFFVQYIKSHLLMDYQKIRKDYSEHMQYLAHDIRVEKDYSNFIDCGAFDGDTICNLIRQETNIKNIVAFEPQNGLCEKIINIARVNKSKLGKVVVFPCGVHSKTEKLKFSSDDDVLTASHVDELGTEIIQCVAIDDVLHDFNPTFIKMDIEGAEIEALKGAKRTIQGNRPQLAICVYHRLSDIWEIPILIKSFYEGYKFYLSSYSDRGLETVLYAFPEQR